MLIPSAIITGFGVGSMYGLLALGFYVTYAVSKTVNFAQGSAMMLGAVLAFSFSVTLGWPMWLAIVVSLVLCAMWGVTVERVCVRPFIKRGSDTWLMATVAMGIILENVVLFTFGKDPRGLPPSLLTTEGFYIADLKIQALQVVIPVVGLSIAVGLHFFSHRTKQGKALLAVVQNPDMARLMGINVSAAIIVTYALSGLFAGVAGMLIAPLFIISSTMGTLFGIKAFAVAILGGITNAWGVMVAGHGRVAFLLPPDQAGQGPFGGGPEPGHGPAHGDQR